MSWVLNIQAVGDDVGNRKFVSGWLGEAVEVEDLFLVNSFDRTLRYVD